MSDDNGSDLEFDNGDEEFRDGDEQIHGEGNEYMHDQNHLGYIRDEDG